MKNTDENPASSVPKDAKPESSPASESIHSTEAGKSRTVDDGQDWQAKLSGFVSGLAKIPPEKIGIGVAAFFAVAVFFFLFHLSGEMSRLREKNAALESQLRILREHAETANRAAVTLQNELATFEQQVVQNLGQQQAVIRELQHARSAQIPAATVLPATPAPGNETRKNDDPRQNYIDFVETTGQKLFALIRGIFTGIWEFLARLAA